MGMSASSFCFNGCGWMSAGALGALQSPPEPVFMSAVNEVGGCPDGEYGPAGKWADSDPFPCVTPCHTACAEVGQSSSAEQRQNLASPSKLESDPRSYKACI